jgi:hypothetical protein
VNIDGTDDEEDASLSVCWLLASGALSLGVVVAVVVPCEGTGADGFGSCATLSALFGGANRLLYDPVSPVRSVYSRWKSRSCPDGHGASLLESAATPPSRLPSLPDPLPFAFRDTTFIAAEAPTRSIPATGIAYVFRSVAAREDDDDDNDEDAVVLAELVTALLGAVNSFALLRMEGSVRAFFRAVRSFVFFLQNGVEDGSSRGVAVLDADPTSCCSAAALASLSSNQSGAVLPFTTKEEGEGNK